MDDEPQLIEVTCPTDECPNQGIPIQVPPSRVVCGPCGALVADPTEEPA